MRVVAIQSKRKAGACFFMFLLALVLFDFLACSGGSHSVETRPGAIQGQSDDRLRQDLASAVHAILRILENGDPRNLLSHISKEGVVFGLEPPPISPSEMRQQFNDNRGVYCLLFDTECLQKEDLEERKRAGVPPVSERLVSFREQIIRARERDHKLFISRENGGLWAEAIVLLDNSEPDGRPLNLEFTYENGAWKLSAVIYH